MDHDAVLEQVQRLHAAGVSLDAVAIRGWLVAQAKWAPRHADEVQEMIGKIVVGRVVRRKSR